MNTEITSRLLDLNARFYQRFSEPFSASRHRVQPGVALLVSESLLNNPSLRWLDLGCGNGNLAHHLLNSGFTGAYVGLDASEDLLQSAKTKLDLIINEDSSIRSSDLIPTFSFLHTDLSSFSWNSILSDEPFDIVSAFAVLHHIPGADHRLKLMRQVNDNLSPGGSFIHSEWQFQNSQRFATRIRSWEEVGIPRDEVEPGDTLLDWRCNGVGLRYVHLFNEVELNELAQNSGFWVRRTFYSDGKEGNVGLYQIWQPINTNLLPPQPPTQR